MFGRKDESRHIGRKLLFWGGIVGLAVYYFDPTMGRSRRAQTKDRIAGMFRRGAIRAERQSRYVAGHVYGAGQEARRAVTGDGLPANDATLVAKIESEVLKRQNYPKGKIVVTSEDGIVSLRGEADTPDQMTALEQEVRKISGVVEVRNFLHLPNTPAPNKQDALNT